MPDRTLFITYTLNDRPYNAYFVRLASEDGTYAIKEFDTGTVIKASGQPVTNPEIGRYEYVFNANDTKIYLVSWEVTANSGDLPVYSEQQVGPFTTNADRIRSCNDFVGTFKQGTTAVIMDKITNFDGKPQDPSFITITIKDLSGVIIEPTVAPEKVASGFYVYQWDIPSTQTIGGYVAVWEYILNGTERVEVQNLMVSSDESTTTMYSGQAYEIRLGLESYLMCAQNIPVYMEQCKTTIDNQTYRFTFPRWNQSSGVKIYRNQNKLLTDGFNVDYFKGEVIFDGGLSDFDMVYADYNFRWFSDDSLYLYLQNAVRTFNSYTPFTNFTIDNIQDRYIATIQKQAAVDALRQLMLCLQFQEPQKVFGGAEQADKVFGNLETVKKNYEEELKDLFEQKKLGPYINLTRAVITSEYTLPGGRSLCDTLHVVGIGNLIAEMKLEDLYEKCIEEKLNVWTLSEDPITGKLTFSPIKCIWVSGNKKVYELLTKSGHFVVCSDEHLFDVNGEYKPLKYMKEGDEVIVYDDFKKIRTNVKKIKGYRCSKKMYDLEVPSTANLFANGIKCHNSRWFRYLFSSGV